MIITNLHVMLDNKSILHDLSLSLSANSVHVLMGPNGSGKSTLAYALMGHPKYAISRGTVSIDTTNILELPIEKRARAGLFLACQHPQEIPGVQVFTFLKEAHRMLTGKELSVSEFKQILYQALDLVRLDHSFAYRAVNQGFSGGEKKRLEIVQLLLFKPKVAILDEIDSGLDVDALKIVAQAIEQARLENPLIRILLITHYSRILEYINPDIVSVIARGKIIASGDKSLVNFIEKQGYDGLLL